MYENEMYTKKIWQSKLINQYNTKLHETHDVYWNRKLIKKFTMLEENERIHYRIVLSYLTPIYLFWATIFSKSDII